MNIAIMGTGGMGGYFGGLLAYSGLDVLFIARGENLSALRERGLQVYSPKGDFTVYPVKVHDNPEEIGPVDLILFCVKAYDTSVAMEAMRPMIGPQTMILPLINGIDHIAKLQEAIGEQHILGGMAMVNAHKGAPGVVHHIASPGRYQIEFGEWTGGVSPRCQQLHTMFSQADLNVMVVSNISERMW